MQYLFEPIGVVRSPFTERAEAPRQTAAARGVPGRVELFAGRGFEDALEGLGGWDYAWVVFVFHRNVEEGRGWRPKVQPPRAEDKVGVFATRSPHRPNPIGMSAVKIERVEGLVVHVRGLDLLDGTPVLDLKPYVPYADAYPGARSGWLEAQDPRAAWEVTFSAEADAQLAWLETRGIDLRAAIAAVLALGPAAARVPAYPQARGRDAPRAEGVARRLRGAGCPHRRPRAEERVPPARAGDGPGARGARRARGEAPAMMVTPSAA